ncbi:MAG: undecaprenyl/decaprenyl-phosphate alpha-N-acetylglucosaminyl 1-phosphate transferase [Candidatus Omnitrophica bacterium]|nr:undecaprenyl/decaprenyl-phosphate alpha-N-acetylglucosaminyl 1-phosphate transferase [Candidatus Omnitrophota bacterium]
MLNLNIYIFLYSFLLSSVIIFIIKNISLKRKIFISQDTPLIGGIAIGISFILSAIVGFSIFGGFNIKILGFLLASFLMLLFGIIDDYKEFSVPTKFFVQIIATLILVSFNIKTQIMGIGNLLNLTITFLWVIGITNAFNHLDIIDGLAGGVSFIVGLSFFIISLFNKDMQVMVVSLVLLGPILSFLIYNMPPAKIYMGNSGSHLVGFILSSQAIMLSYASLDRKVALVSPILILGCPIYDTSFLILMRLKNKRSIFRKSKDHLVFRFLSLTHSYKKSLIYMYLITIIFSASGIAISQLSNIYSIFIIFSIGILATLLTINMSKINVQ